MRHENFSHNYYSTSRKTHKSIYKKLFTFFVLLFFIFLLFSLIKKISSSPSKTVLSSDIISPMSKAYIQESESSPSNIRKSELSKVVENSLEGTTGVYGIEIINLKTGEEYSKNKEVVFEAASLYKLWVMAVVYSKIESGSLSLTDKLSEDVKILNKKFNINEDVAEKKDGTISLKVKDALNLMITKSDNYAALLLVSRIKLSSIQSFLKDIGLIHSRVGTNGKPPSTTAYDSALFMNKLYNGELGSENNTNQMISLLKAQVLNEKIPKYLPISVSIAHKTGELDEFGHDLAIVYSPNGTYILSILSKSDDRDLVNERIANLSKAVYDYFN